MEVAPTAESAAPNLFVMKSPPEANVGSAYCGVKSLSTHF
ncbi:hypothetical protein Sinac_2437 [Singulisphaera acidiphila DSM 18658]|uniref:Uncharacterized protein n=1 Tax=Singulisphaera acidiphila (strain ATCC BAA-1392 / DSM 18658 / VKM B-2454 / MOB10) TaxID=886293 RepID=L0DD34_SINAD|nr:hypothetical protein Sinac_2437 [Singulisphaera acidiphila DSM 18658]